MPRDLTADQAMLREVLALAQSRDIGRAAAIAERELASGFEHPLLLNVLATRLEHAGRFEAALPLLERAVAIAPGDVPARNALALCLQRVGRPADALEHAEELIRQDPTLGFAHANRGDALIALGWLSRARASHLRALELDPGNLAALASLASIASHLGKHAEAREWAAQALAKVPGLPSAVLSLAAADLADGDAVVARTRLQALLSDPRVAPSDRARANGILGDVLDTLGHYPEAFAAYRECNEALRLAHRRRFEGEGDLLAYTRALITGLESIPVVDRSAVAAAPSGATRGHVFLIGFPRSGTTLLEVALDGHPAVASLEEHELLTEGVVQLMRDPAELGPLLAAPEAQLAALREAYWERVKNAGLDVRDKVFVDKHPLNTLKLPLIARLFPDARILFAYRDPRDVVLSCFRRRFKMNPAMYQMLTLQGAATFYDAVMVCAEGLRPRLGLAWHEVRYESLVGAFETEMRAICEFIGLDWVPGLDEFAGRVQSREHATPSTAQLAAGLQSSSVARWRHYADALAPVQPTLAPWVARFGYPA